MKHLQRGISLIEVMIAMTLGLLLLAGIVQIFLSSKQSYSMVIGQSQTLDNGRLAMHFMGDALRKSGYWSDGWNRNYGSDSGLVASSYTGVFDEAQYVFGLNNDAADAAVVDGTDQVYLRFNGDAVNPMSNCVGTTIAETQVAVERYYLRVPGVGEDLPSLVCETTVLNINTGSGAVTSAGTATTTQPLITGVENMQILFGVRNAAGTQMNFQAANVVSDWGLVESVKIALLTASSDLARTEVLRTTGFDLLGVTTATPTDSRVRRVFEQTIALRNPNANPAL